MLKVLRLPINTKGRDIIVGDVHGCFLALKRALISIKFNKNVDRLIIAGDLVDRGPNSKVAVDWIQQPWCFSVMGNHDLQYAFLNDSAKFSQSIVCMPPDPWWVELEEGGLEAIGEMLRANLPPAIEIDTRKGLVGIVHADVPRGLSWTKMVDGLNAKDYDLLHDCVWSRDNANLAIKGVSLQEEVKFKLDNVAHVFHGHSPARKLDYKPYQLANRYFIDTAAYKAKKTEKYPCAGITLYDANDPDVPVYQPYKIEPQSKSGLSM